MLSFLKDELNETLRHFYNVTGIKIVMYNSERQILVTYPESFNPYCTLIRSNGTLAKRCYACDNLGFDMCDKTGKPCIYTCHMSITEAISPIYANDTMLGYLMFGQVLCTDDAKKARECALEVAESFGIDKECLTQALTSFTTASKSYLISALNIMSMCAGFLYTNEIIKNNPDALASRIKEYIHRHISEEMSTAVLCRLFYVSKSRLYKISISSFGMGITQYIRKARLEKAKELLVKTSDTVAMVASSVGISDANYFVRIFKEYTSLTPGQYRKKSTHG